MAFPGALVQAPFSSQKDAHASHGKHKEDLQTAARICRIEHSMIKADNLSFAYPQKDLFNNISFTLEPERHCALIGASGSGKSTLLDILMEPDRIPFDGRLSIEPDIRIGYVRQFAPIDRTTNQTVRAFMGEAYDRLQERLVTVCTALETATDPDALLEDYQHILDSLDAIGGDDFESRIDRQLGLAGLLSHRERLLATLSGGEQKLVQMMREMLLKPDLLILDEPDAYLDFSNLEALKSLMNAHRGALLVITHNRYLLNHCFHKILHLEGCALQEFDGRYVDYTYSLLEAKIDQQELRLADDAEIERNDVMIERFRENATYNSEASRGKALKARVKVQERLMARRIQAPFTAIRRPEIRLPWEGPQAQETILRVQAFSADFGTPLLDAVSFELKANEKLALIGANGSGKTTLLQAIQQARHPAIELDQSVRTAYLTQFQGEMLNGANTVQDEFLDASMPTLGAITAHLAAYGFGDDILPQRIATLSGGEKTLLQLAKIALANTGLLLLDEPTSHLDTYAQLALEEAIAGYKGAVLMVSHDFYTIANCMDAVLLIEDRTVRKVSMKKFRKRIHANHYNKDYIAIEQRKRRLETHIEQALQDADVPRARNLSGELKELVTQLDAIYDGGAETRAGASF